MFVVHIFCSKIRTHPLSFTQIMQMLMTQRRLSSHVAKWEILNFYYIFSSAERLYSSFKSFFFNVYLCGHFGEQRVVDQKAVLSFCHMDSV